MILNSEQGVKYPFSGRNTQQAFTTLWFVQIVMGLVYYNHKARVFVVIYFKYVFICKYTTKPG